jgi:hypothetical protein
LIAVVVVVIVVVDDDDDDELLGLKPLRSTLFSSRDPR